jgi:Holliday junction resolvase RusA-like endonuclease
MPQVVISVREQCPIPWGGNEWTWRKAVSERARAVRETIEEVLPKEPRKTQFSVTLLFLMMPGSIERADLDNLAKPVLDTLFHSRNAQVQDKTLTGAMFDVDDDRVFRLVAAKKSVVGPNDEGIDITIAW